MTPSKLDSAQKTNAMRLSGDAVQCHDHLFLANRCAIELHEECSQFGNCDACFLDLQVKSMGDRVDTYVKAPRGGKMSDRHFRAPLA